MPVVRLTAKERILVHLADFAKYAETVEVPPEMGQERIAQAAGIHVQHVRQFLDPLLKEGLARERTAHVKGHRRRLKVYDLTDSGRRAAARLREEVRGEAIRVRDDRGVRETTVGELLRETSGTIPLASVVRAAGAAEVVDLAALRTKPATEFLARLGEAPRLGTFVGRGAELDALTHDDGGPRVFVVRGVAGIGKSSLAAKACDQLRTSRNVYWHQIRPWDTRPSILAGLGEFLSAISRPGLRAVLGRGEIEKSDSVLKEDLPGSRCVLVFDDAHQAIPEVLSLLRFLKDAMADAPDGRAIVISRRAVPFYDRRDVAIRRLVREIDLPGLDRTEVAAMLPPDFEGSRLNAIARKLGGHPLFVELLRAAAPHGLAAKSLTDVRRFIEEEIYAELTAPERRMMKMAALFEVPFPREAVLVDPSLSHDVLLALTAKSLVRPIGDEAFGVHETIRDFFASILTPAERDLLGPLAIEQLVGLSEQAKTAKDFVAALNCLSNALELASTRHEHGVLSERLGDAYERLGDLPAALAAYGEAIRHLDEPESIATVRRKTATALQDRGETTAAAQEVEESFKALGERPSAERGWLHLLECRIASSREEWAEAREHGEAALESFRGMGDAPGEAQALLQLGTSEIYSPRGDPTEAERCLTSALEVSKPLGDPEFEARVHVHLANLYAYRIGDLERATSHIEGFRALEPTITDPHVLRSILMLRAWFALYQQADFDRADQSFTDAVALAQKIHDHRTVVFANDGLAQSLFLRGDAEAALRRFQEFRGQVREVGVPGDEVETLWAIAECCLVLGDLDGVRKVAAEIRDPRMAEGAAARPLQARVLEGLDRLLRGDAKGCRDQFEEAARVAKTSYLAGEAVSTGFVHFYYGVALRALDREAEGAEHVRQAKETLSRGGLRAQVGAIARDEPRVVEALRRGYRVAHADDA